MFFIWLKPSLNALHFSCYEFCLKVQESRVRKRVFCVKKAVQRLKKKWSGLGLDLFPFHTPFFGLHPPEPICSFFDIFDFFFLGWLYLFFLMPLKFLKYFFHHFLYLWHICLFISFIYIQIYMYTIIKINRK